MADNIYQALQEACTSILLANPEISEPIHSRVYSERPPQSVRRPFARFNSMEKRTVRSACGRAVAVIFSIEIHDRSDRGDTSIKTVAQLVLEALDRANPVLSYGNLVFLRYVTDSVGLESDGLSYSAILVFEALIDF